MSIVTDRAVRAQEDICQPDIGECAYQDRRTGIISVPTGPEDGDQMIECLDRPGLIGDRFKLRVNR